MGVPSWCYNSRLCMAAHRYLEAEVASFDLLCSVKKSPEIEHSDNRGMFSSED